MAKSRVFVDTNVIIESFRTKCWLAICEHYAVETVEKCIEEAMTGDRSHPRYVPVDPRTLRAGPAESHRVAALDIAALALGCPQSLGLDAGEMELLAYLRRVGISPEVTIMLSTTDKAAIVVAGLLEWLDRLVSLESLANRSGVARSSVDGLARHYRTLWLGEIKTKIRLGIMP